MKLSARTTACCATDTGLVRSHNEDTCLVNNSSGYFLVADGIGGAAAGKMAGEMFCEAVAENFSRNTNRAHDITKQLIKNCFISASTKIASHVTQVPAHSGMGCTAELLVICNDEFTLGHIGDSRTYRLREGQLDQLTSDHTVIQDLMDQGMIEPGQEKNHPMRNIILRAINGKKDINVDLIHGTVYPDDIFLLCTDGLSNMIDDIQIKKILAFEWSLDVKATMLIDQANYAGGKDNITVVLIQVNRSQKKNQTGE